ncbi:unnamed protein product, partial [Prorocentrum cordatum]
MAYVQDRGTKAMQRFVRSRVRKLTADLEETKEWASARENAAFEAVDDWTLVSAVETIFSRNAASFDVRELAAPLRDILMVGPKKTTRVPFLVGPSNSGKSTVVYPFDDLFTPKRVLHKPALGSSFGLRNLASGTKRFIFWDDFRPVEFAHEKTAPVSLFLSLFVGQHTEIQVSQSFNDGNKDVCWNRGAVFTGKLEGLWETTNKVGAEDIRHMQNRVRQFPFTSVLSDGSLQDVLSRAPCMTAWIVREAAKFDAVGVFRPAPAAPVGADAGVPPVSGFDDLMSDARIPRAQADALLADVRAMGAVAVDEVLPADWVRLNSWALLLPLQKRRCSVGTVLMKSAPRVTQETGCPKPPVLRAASRATPDYECRRVLRRGPAETRGRKPKLTAVKLRALNNARVRLIRAAKGEAEVHLKDVMKAARVSDVHKGTAEERAAACSGWKRLPGNYFTHQVDAIIDNKVFSIPMTKRVLKPFTKPKGNQNRVNPGAKVHVAAAIVNNKVRVWHYLPTLWCADAACDFYAGVLAPALRRCRKGRRAFRILGDNDPAGYKSKKAVDCKRRGLKITPIKFPKYSPDLNPLDYFLWAEVNRRMAEQSAPANESQSAYKARLRRVAMGIPKSVIRAAVAKMKTKAAEDRGTKTMQRFVRSRVRKLTADLEETKEWASARENAAFEAVDVWTLVCRCAEETCPHGPACSYRSAVETIFSRSAASFDVRELAASLRDILMVGPKMTTRVPFLVGPSNSGKSTVVYPFDDLFTPKRVLHRPALGSPFGLRNLASGTKRFIFWDDFRPGEFAHEKTVPVSLFLSLFVGQHTEIQVSQSFNDGNKDACWNHGAVFTGKLEGLWETTNKVGAEDIRHMQNRARQFPFTSVLSDGSLQDVLSCAPCMTAWIVREAAKFEAVGVFRPAPAAPVGADAGVPPVSGFDDLMSDARIPRAQADALLADVRAMGAVAVDEVLPADWVRLNSWALLLPLQKRRLLGQIGSP